MSHHYNDIRAMEVRERPAGSIVSFSVACVPVAQPRQRHRVVRSGMRAYAQNYTPATHPVQTFKANVILDGRLAMQGRVPLSGPIEVRIMFRFPLPSSARALSRRIVEAGAYVPYSAVKRNDGDNLEKAVWDALTGVCWEDDGQICRWSGERVYAKEPGVDVWIAEYV